MESVLELIAHHQHVLTRGQRLVAEVIHVRPNEAAMFTIQDFAREAGVSDATVLRFARTLGFPGYPELKEALQRRLIENVTSWRRVERTLSEFDGDTSVVGEFVGRQVDYLQAMVSTLPDEQLRAVAHTIAHSRVVWLHGEGSAATPCHAIRFWLGRFGRSSRLISGSGRALLDEAVRADSRDSVLFFAFGRETRDAVVLMDWMTERGASTILVTDSPFDRLGPAARHVLTIERGPMGAFHSMAVPVALADALTLAVAKELGPSAVEAIRILDDARTRYDL
ncbi:MAG: MurR/RpiR family transcriptional regulator [Spirochaetaceae bacterium]|nr:MAG: MurR/RpiR family transcriptional regulator [Spirochaetaceae bacterium]